MSKIVFILGAGASKQAGAPLMADFLDVASMLYASGKTDDKQDDFKRVFRAIGALQVVHSKSQLDLTNIESVFNAFEMASILGKLPGTTKDDIPRAISSLKELIVKTLEKTVKFPTIQRTITAPVPYEGFAEFISHLRDEAEPKYSISVLTFNYDIAADVALFRQGLGPYYGLPSQSLDKRSVSLLKLHGSLNWASQLETGTIYPLAMDRYLSSYRPQSLESRSTTIVPISTQMKKYFKTRENIEVASTPIIVPPTWNKADNYKELASIWALAASELEEAEYVFIIGYSLPETDSFFRLLYALGTVGENPLKKVVIYNPDNQIRNRFLSMLGPGAQARFEYKAMTFEQAIPDMRKYFKAEAKL